MFSFLGFGGQEKEATPAPAATGSDVSQSPVAASEAVPQKSSSDDGVLVEAERGVSIRLNDVIGQKEAMEYDPNIVESTELLEDNKEEGDDIDLSLVEAFDRTFDEFVADHPRFLIENADLVHSLRVAKLQRLLMDADLMENELIEQLETLEDSKVDTERRLHGELMDAARKKAAREIHLSSMLGDLQFATKATEEKLKWKLLLQSETRAKKQFNQHQFLQSKVVGGDRLELLAELPNDTAFEDLREFILDSGTASQDQYLQEQGSQYTPEMEQEIRQLQVDNALLNSELSVLQAQLEGKKMEAKKHAWVESVLVRMEPETLQKLKSNHEKKTGVAL